MKPINLASCYNSVLIFSTAFQTWCKCWNLTNVLKVLQHVDILLYCICISFQFMTMLFIIWLDFYLFNVKTYQEIFMSIRFLNFKENTFLKRLLFFSFSSKEKLSFRVHVLIYCLTDYNVISSYELFLLINFRHNLHLQNQCLKKS